MAYLYPFTIFIILVGCYGHEIYKKFRLLRTVTMMSFGLLSGYIALRSDQLDVTHKEFHDLTNNFFFTLFFPCNIFMLGYTADYHIFRREVYNVWILGTIAYWIYMIIVKLILEYIIFPGG